MSVCERCQDEIPGDRYVVIALPERHWETIQETLEMDAKSIAFAAELRLTIRTALASVTDITDQLLESDREVQNVRQDAADAIAHVLELGKASAALHCLSNIPKETQILVIRDRYTGDFHTPGHPKNDLRPFSTDFQFAATFGRNEVEQAFNRRDALRKMGHDAAVVAATYRGEILGEVA